MGMTDTVSTFVRVRVLDKLRWIAPVAALGLLFAVGAGLGLATTAQQDYREAISSAVSQRWAAGGTAALLQAALLLALWTVVRVARKAALFAAFIFVERALPGPPVDRRAFRFALAVQSTIAVLYAVAATFLLLFPSLLTIPPPLVSIGEDRVSPLLGPMAPFAVALAALLTYDFLDYWVHRAQHHFAFLWRFHSVHHSVEELDALNSYQHPIDVFVSMGIFTIVSLLVGFSFQTMLWFVAFQAIQSRLVHTRAPIHFGPLGALLVDNRTHHLHHTRCEARSGKNFAGTFTICDRLFGTYERPEAGPLPATGLDGLSAPPTVRDFFLAKLGTRPA
jgi:sterol desaturase/sphingolipid hydroxylase (fatty acid hydroxylase superfamily)